MKPDCHTPSHKKQAPGIAGVADLRFQLSFVSIVVAAALLAFAVLGAGGASAESEADAAQDSIASLPVAGCTDGSYVGNPGDNSGLVSDCKVLVGVRNHWTGLAENAGLPGTHPLRTWGSGSRKVGSWEGVSVSGQRVIGLDLSAYGALGAEGRISGTLPAELGDLASLTHLDLGRNRLTGSIPGELGDLSNLTDLDLNSNQLTGTIPEELGDLANLTALDLGNNRLTGTIPEDLGDLSSLTHLDIYGNKLEGSIPEELGDLSSLTLLRLSRNGLTGTIPGELGDLTSLTHLDLGSNSLTGTIPGELGDLASLTYLDLSGNHLEGTIPGELWDLTGLTDLDLGGNQLEGTIPGEVGDLASLKILSLGDNELRGPIPGELGDLTGLTHLYLNDNQLMGSVPEGLGDLSPSQDGSLVGLYICRNMLSVTLPTDLRGIEGDVSGCAAAPADLAAVAGDRQVMLSWSDPGSTEIRGYEYRVCEPGGVNCGVWSDIPGSGASTTSYVANELENRKNYLFQLRAENRGGPGMSSEVGARPNIPLTVDAGADRTVAEGEAVVLSGSVTGAEGEELVYLWEQTGGTPTVTLGGADTATAGFTAAEQLVSDAALEFRLTVRDGVRRVSDTVTVTVTAGENDAPTAKAGEDQTVDEGALVTLDGSGSSDPEGEGLTYRWGILRLSGLGVFRVNPATRLTLSDTTAQRPTFTAPTQLVRDGVAEFSLVVTDARGKKSSKDTVTVTVKAGENQAPVAKAGGDQTVDEGEAVTLDGSGSSDPEREPVTYKWTQTSGPEVALNQVSWPHRPKFTAPQVSNDNAVLEFSLVVTDARGKKSSADTVSVTVRAGENDAPTANAGYDQVVLEGSLVTLDGSESSDPESEALTYAWTQTSGPDVTLSSSTVERPTFTAPVQLTGNVVYEFSVVVTDARGLASSADAVKITVRAGENDAPVAEAGDNQTVDEGASVTLDGSGSSDPEGEELTYAWTKTRGPAVTLSSSTAKRPTFTAPVQLAGNATLVFSLVVTDARGLASAADTVSVTVRAGENDAPTAEAGDNQTVDAGAAVTLDGSGSSDPEGEELTYAWTQSSGTTVTLSSSTAKRPTFRAPTGLTADETLVFSLVVTDARGLASSADRVSVTVTKAPGLVLSRTSMSVTDNGSRSSLTVKLDTRPTGRVTVAVAFAESEEDDATLSVSSLTFTTSNWNTNQTVTVTGRDDGGTSAETANFTLNPSGANYYNADTVTVSVTVNRYVAPPPTKNPPGRPGGRVLGLVVVGNNIHWRTEFTAPTTGGTPTFYEYRINSEEDGISKWFGPLSNLDVLNAFGNIGWGHPDSYDNGTLWFQVRAGNDDGVGPIKQLNAPPNPPRLLLSKTSMSVTDAGSSDSLKVRLSTEPTGTVTVAVAFVNSGEDDATLSTSSLTFTTSNWNTSQTVTVTGKDDGDSTEQTANFTLNPSGADYDSVDTVTVKVAIIDGSVTWTLNTLAASLASGNLTGGGGWRSYTWSVSKSGFLSSINSSDARGSSTAVAPSNSTISLNASDSSTTYHSATDRLWARDASPSVTPSGVDEVQWAVYDSGHIRLWIIADSGIPPALPRGLALNTITFTFNSP